MEIKIAQDIRKFKTKDIGNFSFKEVGFIAVAGLLGFSTYKFTGSMEIAFAPASIPLVFGFFKPNGMAFSEFLRTVVKDNLSVQEYKNHTDFEYDMDKLQEEYGNEYVICNAESGNEVIQTVDKKQQALLRKAEKEKFIL